MYSKSIKTEIMLRLIKILNPVMMAIPFYFGWLLYYSKQIKEPYTPLGTLAIIGLYIVVYVILGRIYDAFLISFQRISELIYSQSLAALLADGFFGVLISLLAHRIPNVIPMFIVLFVQVLLAVCWAKVAHNWYFNVVGGKKTVIIYDQRTGINNLINQYGLKKKFKVRRIISINDCLENNLECLNGIEVAFLCGIHTHDRNIVLKECIARGVLVYLLPRLGDVIMSGAKQMHMFHLPMLRIGRYSPNIEFLFVKRVFDIFSSALAILILSPIFIITAIAIKMDGGPAFYKQVRLTKDGKEFEVLKFRSMRVDAEKDGVARLSAGENDDRITKVGKIIRKVRIDELPQLINILKGDMSVVGPRPERPEIAEQYYETLPEFKLRLQAKAGLTGYAQVYGKYNTTPYDKLQMDLFYIAHPSIFEDLRIIMATIKILFIPESTEGIEVGQTTAMDSGHR